MAKGKNPDFQYFLSKKLPVLMVTFVGSLDFLAVDLLNQCREEILEIREAKYIIFYFRDVEDVTGDGIGALTQIQLDTRARCKIRITSMKPNIREKLVNMGVIRQSEIANNMKEALTSLIGP